MDLMALDKSIQESLIKKVDHKHLNLDVDFLAPIIPTAENLVYAFWGVLSPVIPPPATLHRLRLFESRKNVAEYQGE
ncbi:MAG: 6-carboxytetrahydropterin synthase [Cyanobacteria bacterium]|nr:6-carboxytetrahydropterin synthase [Cyanobacteriota bacterium]